MTREKCLIILKDFTQTFEDVNFDFCGVDWWPLIKIQVAYQLHLLITREINNKTYHKPASLKLNEPKYNFKMKLRFWKQMILKPYKTKSKVAVFTQSGHYSTMYKGKIINQFTDPFLMYFKELEISYSLSNINKQNRYFQIFQKNYSSKTIKQFNKNIKFQKQLLDLSKYLELKIDANFSLFSLLSNTIVLNQASFLTYCKLFSSSNYKTALIYVYYDNTNMAICRAAKKTGIKTFEYQHSQISSKHFAYGGWTERIARSNCFFPDTIWVWKENDVKYLSETFKALPRFSVILGGNVYASQYVKKNIKTENPDVLKILITLQGMGLPSFLYNYISKSKNIIWFIRIHPRYQADREMINELQNINPKFIEIEKSNTLSLLDLLSEVDYHMTCFSGSALEAQILNVQNIIFGEEGYLSYKEQIENNSFLYVTNEGELNKIFKDRIITKTNIDIPLSDKKTISKKIISNFKNLDKI